MVEYRLASLYRKDEKQKIPARECKKNEYHQASETTLRSTAGTACHIVYAWQKVGTVSIELHQKWG